MKVLSGESSVSSENIHPRNSFINYRFLSEKLFIITIFNVVCRVYLEKKKVGLITIFSDKSM